MADQEDLLKLLQVKIFKT